MTSAVLDRAWELLADIALKSCVLCALAGGGLLLLRRSAAASRRLVLLLLMCFLPTLPLLSALLPGLQWSGYPFRASQTAASPAIAPPPALAPVSPAPPVREANVPFPEPAAPVAAEPTPSSAVLPPASLQPLQSTLSPRPPAPLHPAAPLERLEALKWGLLALWLLGCAGVLLRVIAGLVVMSNRRRRSAPVVNEEVLRLAAGVRVELDIRSEVLLLQTPEGAASGIPVMWGLLRPVLLLPAPMLHWPAERLRMILLHEMAHIRRLDWPAQMLSQLTCALYWFHPLVWWADHRLREECERACDDCVLLAGIAPPHYAATLLEVLRNMKESPSLPTAALSMARPPIEQRLRAILAARPLQRRRQQRSVSALIWLGALVCGLPFAALHVGAVPAKRIAPLPSVEATQSQATPEPKASSSAESVKPVVLQDEKKSGQDQSDEVAALRKRLEALEKRLDENMRENAKLRQELQSLRAQQKTQGRANSAAEKANAAAEKANTERRIAAQRAAVEAQIQAAQRQLKVQLELLKVAEDRYKAGVATVDATIEVQAQLESTKSQIQMLEQQLQILKAGHSLTSKEWEQKRLQAELEVAEANLQRDEELLRLAQQRYAAGLAPQVLEAESKVAAAKTQIESIKLRIAQSTSNF